jgi:hypothetical protein
MDSGALTACISRCHVVFAANAASVARRTRSGSVSESTEPRSSEGTRDIDNGYFGRFCLVHEPHNGPEFGRRLRMPRGV